MASAKPGTSSAAPAEVLLKGMRHCIFNRNNPVKYFVNTKPDAPHTESYIDLK